MQQVTPEIVSAFERRLNLAKVPPDQHLTYYKWLNFYFLFCQKFGYSPGVPTSARVGNPSELLTIPQNPLSRLILDQLMLL
jgi:hypothetical protein